MNEGVRGLDVLDKGVLVSEVGEGLVDEVAVLDGDDVVGELDQAELFAVVVDAELLPFLHVDVVDQGQLAHGRRVALRSRLDRLHPESKFGGLVLLDLVFVEVEVKRTVDGLRNEVKFEIGPVVKCMGESGAHFDLLVDDAEPPELDLVDKNQEKA